MRPALGILGVAALRSYLLMEGGHAVAGLELVAVGAVTAA